MLDLTKVKHHPALDELVPVLSIKADNADLPFFRVIVAYYLSMMAATMRATVVTGNDEIPANCYALALAPSGTGKGRATTLMESAALKGFRERFISETLPEIAEQHMWMLASQRAAKKGTEDQNEYNALAKEYESCGAYAFVYDNGSGPAIKQMRQKKLLIANAGALNLIIDELAQNLLGASEALSVYLELYDQGLTRAKITMNSSERKRTEEITGKTPANLLLFGEPMELFKGDETENKFYSFLQTGYARRTIFAYGRPEKLFKNLTPKEVIKKRRDTSNQAAIDRWTSHFTYLADINKYDWQVSVPEAVEELLVAYQQDCEKRADLLPKQDIIRRAELTHRYFQGSQAGRHIRLRRRMSDHGRDPHASSSEAGGGVRRVLPEHADPGTSLRQAGAVYRRHRQGGHPCRSAAGAPLLQGRGGSQERHDLSGCGLGLQEQHPDQEELRTQWDRILLRGIPQGDLPGMR